MTQLHTPQLLRDAILDAIAVGETGGGDADAAYAMCYGGGYFSPLPITTWPKTFPTWAGRDIGGGRMSHACGRYQFEPATWAELQIADHLPDFSPVSQDKAAWRLVFRKLLSAGVDYWDFAATADALKPIWPSVDARTFGLRIRAALQTILYNYRG